MDYKAFKKVKINHVPALYDKNNRWVSYKNISINQIFKEISLPGDFLQFGVFRGHTARIIQSLILSSRTLHLFDSFEGLPEAWGNTHHDKGSFFVGKDSIPKFDPKLCKVHVGWFSDTIGPYKEKYKNPISFIHLDADLYSSTKTILYELNDLIVPDTILLFDEFFMENEKGISDEECRAFLDWAKDCDRQYQILWRTEWVQCAIKILK